MMNVETGRGFAYKETKIFFETPDREIVSTKKRERGGGKNIREGEREGRERTRLMGAADRAETGVPAEGLVGAEAPKGRAELGPCPGPPPTRGPPLVVEGEKEDGPGFVVIGVEGELL